MHRRRRRGILRVGPGTVFLDYNSDDLERILPSGPQNGRGLELDTAS